MDLNWVRNFMNSDFIESIITGLIASMFFALFLWFFKNLRYYLYLRRKFNNRTFHTFYKRFSNEIIQEVKCKTYRNVLKFKRTNVIDGRTFNGEIIFNPINLRIGEGFQAYDNSDAFNFTKVIIKSDCCFLVDASYVAMKEVKSEDKKSNKSLSEEQNRIVYGLFQPEAFIWRKVD